MLIRILSIMGNLILLVVVLLLSVWASLWCLDYWDQLRSEGAFTRWRSISEPPSKLERILLVDYSTIWIETDDKSIYYLSILCWLQLGECRENEWIKTETLPDEQGFSYDGYRFEKQNSCDFQDKFEMTYFQQPSGNVVECLKTYSLYPEAFVITYYARFSDDKIQYWHVFSSANAYLNQLIGVGGLGLFGGIILFLIIKSKWKFLKSDS